MNHSLIPGLIPAHAGKTHSCSSSPPAREAHPRSRGENVSRKSSPPHRRGSSPLTRGKPTLNKTGSRSCGLIPAHAGKTACTADRNSDGWAHPRSRGENELSAKVAHNAQGSSPLTRGKPPSVSSRRWDPGLIPAHAGKTTGGEEVVLLEGGSSPLTRGKQQVNVPEADVLGLIPAHAGKTDTGGVSTYGHGAHPRSRGENATSGSSWGLGVGSSPLTRGKLHLRREARSRHGLIPAHAGKTVMAVIGLSLLGAHPRSRGENSADHSKKHMREGSSPLTRGKPKSSR